MLLGEVNYEYIKFFLQSFLGKFLILCLTWSFSFQILSEIRHLFWDLGYGFELITSKITGLIVIFGSFVSNNTNLFNWKTNYLTWLMQQKNGYFLKLVQ